MNLSEAPNSLDEGRAAASSAPERARPAAAKSAGKILVIRGGAIGDFILTLPVFSALRRQFPGARLEVLGYPHIVELALAGGLADHVTSIEARALAGFFAGKSPLDDRLAGYFAGFSLIISYLYDPDEIFRSNIARCSKAQFIAGPHRPNETANLHAAEVFLQPLERLAIFGADPVPRLAVKTALGSSQRTLASSHDSGPSQDRCVAFHPGSGSDSKNWPEEKWAEFLHDWVKTSDRPLLLIGGEAEGDRLARLAAGVAPHPVQLAQHWPLVELALRLGQCRAYVGHDSGISHLAAALGLEGLVLWGNTNAAVWRPRGGRLQILQSGSGLDRFPVDRLARALNDLLTCRCKTG